MVDFLLGPAEGEEESFTHQLRGVIPRAFEYLFSLVNREQEKVKLKLVCFLRIVSAYEWFFLLIWCTR